MSLNDQQDLIHQSKRENHNIQKYHFKAIHQEEDLMALNEVVEPVELDEGMQTPPIKQNQTASFERELIEKLLQKTDELSSSLAKMQIQAEKQQLSLEEKIALTKSDAYKDGLRDGEKQAKDAMLEELEKEKQALVHAVIALEKSLQQTEAKLQEFEKELAHIAVDIAREVIIKEVEEQSQQIALQLAKTLIESIKDVAQIQLHVNTLDYPYLREHLDLKNINLQADDNIARGGVVISSNGGNIDGNIMSRFRLLKQNVLDDVEK